jgi:O-antigen biosynthesis protein
MPMSDPPLGRPPGEPAGDESEALQRLRLAEADMESLQDVLLSQESLADRLTMALHASAQSRQELTRVQQDLTQALRSAGWRGLARAGKRRAVRLLAARRPAADLSLQPVEPVADASASTAEEVAWTDIRYGDWIELYDTVDDETRRALVAQVEEIPEPPLISVIFPVYNAPEEFLRQAIDSVRAQLYTKWELCIADDCSTLPHVAKVLDEYAALDDRILVHRRQANGHISACSNSAVALASGSWLCLMDHDDVLAEHALAVCALALHRRPEAAVLYSDEDHIEADGSRSQPYFKPDFDPLLILGQNYFSHLSVVRADLVELVGGFREGYEGSQDWDLLLRVLEHVRPDQVVHVPHVLYHWRVHSESTASAVSAKPYVVDASRRVVEDHLKRIGVDATVTTVWDTSYNRIRWELPANPPKVSIIILPRSGPYLARCIDSVRMLTPYPQLEILLVDDGGFHPPMRRMVSERAGWLTLLENTDDLSDSAQRNFAAKQASGDVLCFLSDHVEVLGASWLHELVGTLSHPGIGCVGAKLLYPNLRIQSAGTVLGIGGTVGSPHRLFFERFANGYSGHLRLARCPSAVSWATMAVRRDLFDEIGGFSEEHFSGVFGDVDFCLRLNEAGWRTAWTPYAEMIHFELPEDGRAVDGANAIRFDRDIRYLRRRWGKWVEDDPSYSPNLSLAHESLSLAWPPRRSYAPPRRASQVFELE